MMVVVSAVMVALVPVVLVMQGRLRWQYSSGSCDPPPPPRSGIPVCMAAPLMRG